MKLSLVLSTDVARFEAVVYKGDVHRHLAEIAALGYDGVELAVRDPDTVDLAAIETSLRAERLAVSALGTGQAYGEDGLSLTDPRAEIRAEAMRRLQGHIQLAAQLGAVVIVGLIRGRATPETPRAQALAWLEAALGDCAAHAEAHGVRLVLEPINRYETDLINTLDDGLALLRRVGAPPAVLGLLPDTFHMNIEEASLEDSLRRAAGHILHFHAADSNRWHPGAGHLRFDRLLAVLTDEVCYDGWVSVETLPKPDALTAAKEGLRHLRACLEDGMHPPPHLDSLGG
jgi:sugar phosphate isomerase/epimerase